MTNRTVKILKKGSFFASAIAFIIGLAIDYHHRQEILTISAIMLCSLLLFCAGVALKNWEPKVPCPAKKNFSPSLTREDICPEWDELLKNL